LHYHNVTTAERKKELQLSKTLTPSCVGLHQGSLLSPLLFLIVMEIITREIWAGLPITICRWLDLDGREQGKSM